MDLEISDKASPLPILPGAPIDRVPTFRRRSDNPICQKASRSIAIGVIGLLILSVESQGKGLLGRSGFFYFGLITLGALLVTGVAGYVRPRGWAAVACIGVRTALWIIIAAVVIPGIPNLLLGRFRFQMWEWLYMTVAGAVLLLCLPIGYANVKAAYRGISVPGTAPAAVKR